MCKATLQELLASIWNPDDYQLLISKPLAPEVLNNLEFEDELIYHRINVVDLRLLKYIHTERLVNPVKSFAAIAKLLDYDYDRYVYACVRSPTGYVFYFTGTSFKKERTPFGKVNYLYYPYPESEVDLGEQTRLIKLTENLIKGSGRENE